ncbi:amidohydrolase [Moellerella wisconsensis]|uniref:Amidohydrolase n=1 Tax=Moellerella wisconsensis TaxID=158849 RepID=A0ACD3Y7E0_9GAMM|nr:amidohydrolase [Moellerella wisconsensis]KLN95543.1 amidohydrolase [Moellerella wisconsensis]UNH24016.1 amidohydrolase [Moellerella wisconsensis]UNH38733.1 amidohydrolase [Moellerella wisconsensis]UNH42255.1 amidohydrolase [Moellerella wisconsensis]
MNNKVADVIYFNGYIYTADQQNTVVDSIAVADGYILACGSAEQLQRYVGPETESIDLEGKMMMPGIIDGHMHPFWGGVQLFGCHLNYESLTIDEILQRVQSHLDKDPRTGENDWLKVTAWLRQGMLPAGIDMYREDMDRLNTKRPVVLFSNDCHTLLANSRALELLGITKETPTPPDGKIGKHPNGELNGILEDAPAMRAADSIPSIRDDQAVEVAELVQKVLNQQGVTTVMDARVSEQQLAAFAELQQRNDLTVRFQAAREITPDETPDIASVAAAVDKAVAFAKQWHQAEWTPAPGIGLRNIKMFVDGVLQYPTMTASLLAPYRVNKGSETQPDWQETDNYGDLYFTAEILDELLEKIAAAGYDPHLHTVGEGAISIVLDAIEKMRIAHPEKDIRPGLAHNELVNPKDYQRFARLGTIACLSFQWAAPTPELSEFERNMVGETRFQDLEPIAKFIDAGATVAFGSDWPIDDFDEWYDLKVAATRRGHDIDGKKAPRLDTDRNLTVTEVLRAATIDSAYAQHREEVIGSLEPGKFADMIILDRNVFQILPDDIANVKVLCTIVGGKTVHIVH